VTEEKLSYRDSDMHDGRMTVSDAHHDGNFPQVTRARALERELCELSRVMR